GIRDKLVTGVQTCALPIWISSMPGIILSSRLGQRAQLLPLGPDKRLINGRVYYSAAWLGVAPFEPEVLRSRARRRRQRSEGGGEDRKSVVQGKSGGRGGRR